MAASTSPAAPSVTLAPNLIDVNLQSAARWIIRNFMKALKVRGDLRDNNDIMIDYPEDDEGVVVSSTSLIWGKPVAVSDPIFLTSLPFRPTGARGDDGCVSCRLQMFTTKEQDRIKFDLDMPITQPDYVVTSLKQEVKIVFTKQQCPLSWKPSGSVPYASPAAMMSPTLYRRFSCRSIAFETEILVADFRRSKCRPDGSVQMFVYFPGFHVSDLPRSIGNEGPSLRMLYLEEKYSDFRIVTVDGVILPVHKCVLGKHSAVFDGMFQAAMAESSQNLLKLVDFPSPSVEVFVKWMYGSVDREDFKKYSSDLLRLADKYDLLPLKSEAEDYLCAAVDAESVCERLVLAHLHHADKLKRLCMKFVIKNKRHVTFTEHWSDMRLHYPALVLEVQKKDGWGPGGSYE